LQSITDQLVFLTTDIGNVHVVGGRAQLFQLLASEDVNGDEMDLGVTMLASLGGAHLDNLAWAVLDDNMTVLAQSRALHRVRGRGTGVGALEGMLMLEEARRQSIPKQAALDILGAEQAGRIG
jgi:hypothetical protein